MPPSKRISRIWFDGAVLLTAPDGSVPVIGHGLNLCRDGIFVCTDAANDAQGSSRIRFDLPGNGTVEAEAIVTRCVAPRDAFEPTGVALRFASMANDGAMRLEAFIASRMSPAADTTHKDSGDEWDPVHTPAFAAHVSARHQATGDGQRRT